MAQLNLSALNSVVEMLAMHQFTIIIREKDMDFSAQWSTK